MIKQKNTKKSAAINDQKVNLNRQNAEHKEDKKF